LLSHPSSSIVTIENVYNCGSVYIPNRISDFSPASLWSSYRSGLKLFVSTSVFHSIFVESWSIITVTVTFTMKMWIFIVEWFVCDVLIYWGKMCFNASDDSILFIAKSLPTLKQSRRVKFGILR